MVECSECGDEFMVNDGYDDDGLCHPCAHNLAAGVVATRAARDKADEVIRELRAQLLNRTESNAMTMEDHKACPCLHTTPCGPGCTCVMPGSSNGCRRCCSYGSKERQKIKAIWLAQLIDRGVWQSGDGAFLCPSKACVAFDVDTPGNPEGLCHFCKVGLVRRVEYRQREARSSAGER